MSHLPKSPFRKLFELVTGGRGAAGYVDAGTEQVHWSHGVPKFRRLTERVERKHVAADFLAFVSGETADPPEFQNFIGNGRPAESQQIHPAGPDWEKWLAVCDAIADPDVELTIEEFAPFSEMFNRLVALQVPFDDAFVLRVRELQRSVVDTDNDSDMDDSDHGIECEPGGEVAEQMAEAHMRRLLGGVR